MIDNDHMDYVRYRVQVVVEGTDDISGRTADMDVGRKEA